MPTDYTEVVQAVLSSKDLRTGRQLVAQICDGIKKQHKGVLSAASALLQAEIEACLLATLADCLRNSEDNPEEALVIALERVCGLVEENSQNKVYLRCLNRIAGTLALKGLSSSNLRERIIAVETHLGLLGLKGHAQKVILERLRIVSEGERITDSSKLPH